jgi:hypothetical protein
MHRHQLVLMLFVLSTANFRKKIYMLAASAITYMFQARTKEPVVTGSKQFGSVRLQSAQGSMMTALGPLPVPLPFTREEAVRCRTRSDDVAERWPRSSLQRGAGDAAAAIQFARRGLGTCCSAAWRCLPAPSAPPPHLPLASSRSRALSLGVRI